MKATIFPRCWPGRPGVLVLTLATMAALTVGQQVDPDKAARMVLDSARRGYNEKNYPFAIQRFREFLGKYGGHRDAVWAHYGLARALLEQPKADYAGAIKSLQQVVGRADFPRRALALYSLGVANRATGVRTLAQAVAQPAQAQPLRAAAKGQFTEAAKHFAAAATAFAARVKESAGELAWSARARCDECDMLLRIGQAAEAAKRAAALLADRAMSKSRYRPLGLYHLGHAHFRLKQYLLAGKALSRLAPFDQDYGLHARYLLGRVHHLSAERPEAAAQYKAVVRGHADRKKAAEQALRKPAALKPPRKALFERLVRGPEPEYVMRASFYAALLHAENTRYAGAAAAFAAFVQRYPKSLLVGEARLRQGICQVHLRKFPEAIQILQPLVQRPDLADRALRWTARAHVGAADPKNAQTYAQAITQAINCLRQAADRAGQLAAADPAAKARRGDILIELGDTMQSIKQYAQAATVYQQALKENNNPERADEAMQRQITARHFAGDYKASDALCVQFEQTYPTSTLLGTVRFRKAENAYLAATAAAKNPNLPNRKKELARLFGEAARRYARVVKTYPGCPYANLARQGLGASHYRLGGYAEAIAAWSAVPEADRTDDLAAIDYVLADCIIRTLAPEASDAVQAARLAERAGEAARLLERFLGAEGKGPRAPDALLKLGHCRQRIAASLAPGAAKKKALADAKGTYERVLKQFPNHASTPTAVFELSKCLAMLGNANGAVNQLNRFQANPFRASAVAPLALTRLSVLMRQRNQAAQAAAMLGRFRAQHEASILKDPARRDWVATLQYEHALAVKESSKTAEARKIFEALARQFPKRPEAVSAMWRAGQCRRLEAVAALTAARAAADKPGATPAQTAAAEKAVKESLNDLRRQVQSFQTQADALARKASGSPAHLRMLYEAAWCCRALADAEIDSARRRLNREAIERIPTGSPRPAPTGADIPLSAISLRLSERAARDHYRQIIAAGRDATMAIRARLELAEMLAARDEHAGALPLLVAALEAGPSPALAEQVRLRLASTLIACGDAKAALAHARAVASSKAGLLTAPARYLVGEALYRQKDWAGAIRELVPFRDHGPLQRVPDVADRALLRLGAAYAHVGQWEQSRQACEILIARLPASPWVHQARYGIGQAWQARKQYDNAVRAYSAVTAQTVAEVAARAQLEIGLCRLAQKRHDQAVKALLVVPFTYGYPDLSARAWCEAAAAYVQMKKPAEAVKLWQRVVKEFPRSPWAAVARKRLAETTKAKRS